MKFLAKLFLIGCIAMGLTCSSASASIIANWTFETSAPTTAGTFAPEVGVGQASGFHSGASTYSSPAGNGSLKSFSSNTWALGDYYQFSTSTLGSNGITVSWDQTGSNTGPKDFKLSYSTNGTSFSDFVSYSVINGSWSSITPVSTTSFSYDLSALTALSNQATVYFRLVDTSTTAINLGAVQTAGTGRVDNFIISGNLASAVPVPAAAWLLGSGIMALGGFVKRRSEV